MKRLLCLLSLLVLVAGCGKEQEHAERALSYFPDMHDQPSFRAQEYEEFVIDGKVQHVKTMRVPVQGTVPTQHVFYKTAKMDVENANKDINPLPMTSEVLHAGRRAFDIYCIVCHGERAAGDGLIIPSATHPGQLNSGHINKSTHQFPPPPSLTSDRVAQMKDGQIYNTLTQGSAFMPPYGRLPSEMRWAIINYLRVLYKAEHPNDSEYAEYEKNKDDYVDPKPTDIVNNWRDLKY